MNRFVRRLFPACLGWPLLIAASGVGYAQTPFVLDNDYDGERTHMLKLWALDPNADAIDGAVEAPSELAHFKLRVITGSGAPIANAPGCHLVEFKVNINGSWYTVGNNSDVTITTTLGQPLNGISQLHTFQYEARISTIQGNRTRTGYLQPVTIYASNSYHDSDGNTFAQMRRQVPTPRIPILVIEGFDPQNNTYPPALFDLLSPFANTQLYPNGYEVFVLNFKDGGADLRENAAVVTSALSKVRELCPQHGIALVGLSMGGVIGRYALVKEESLGHDHGVGVFISYDSPQQIANINTQFQSQIHTLVSTDIGGQAALEQFRASLRCRAAKQLLEFNTYDPYHSARDSFQLEIHGLSSDGYPHKCNVYGISNGSLQPTWDRSLLDAPLVDFGVAGHPIFQVTMEKRDIGPGSMYINLATKRFGTLLGDIAPALPLDVYWTLSIHRNPVFIPTQSAMDFQAVEMQDEAAPITGWSGTPFREILYQTQPLLHDGFSTASGAKLLEWLGALTPVTVNYTAIDGMTIASDVVNVGLVKATSVSIGNKAVVTSDGRTVTYRPYKWDDGVTSNPRDMFSQVGATRALEMKGVLASAVSGAAWSGVQRRIVSGSDPMGTTYHSAYESAGSIWYTRNIRLTGWQGETRLSSGSTSAPSIAVKSFGGLDQMQVAVGWLNGDGTIGYRSSTISNGSAWNGEVSRAITTQPSGVVVPDVSSLVWVEGTSGGAGVYYYKNPLTNVSLARHLVPGTPGNVSQAACVPSSGCQYEVAFIKDGLIYVSGFSDPNQSDPNIAPTLCGTTVDVSSAGWVPANPSLVSNGSVLYASWDETSGSVRRVAFRERVSGSWSSTTYFSHLGHVTSKPVVGIDLTHGMLNILWDCGGHVAMTSRPLAGGQWTQVVNLAGVSSVGVGRSPTLVDGDPLNSVVLIPTGTVGPYSVVVGYVESLAEPQQVVDLGVDLLSCSEIYLSWTAPSVAGYATVAEYDLRYSDQLITEANFYSMNQLNAGSPGQPGTYEPGLYPEVVGLSGLPPGTRYYFALKSRSGAGIWSPMSNVTWARTLNHAGCGDLLTAGGPNSSFGSVPVLASSFQSLPPTRYELTWSGAGSRQLRVIGLRDTAGTDSVAVKGTISNGSGSDTLQADLESAVIGVTLRARDSRFRLGTTWRPTGLNTLVRTQGEAPQVMRVTRVTLHADEGTSEIGESAWATSPGLCGVGDTLIIDFELGGAEADVTADEWFVIEGDPHYAPQAASRGTGTTASAIVPDRLGIRWVGRGGLEVQVPTAELAKVEIFDASGRRVRVLAHRFFTVGTHTLEWDGLTSANGTANHGLYFCRVSSPNGRAVAKLAR